MTHHIIARLDESSVQLHDLSVTSPFTLASHPADSAFAITTADVSTDASHSSNFVIRTQSNRRHDDDTIFNAQEINKLLARDLKDRVTEVGDGIAACIFPDEAFGFAINEQFVRNFVGSFISSSVLLDQSNFRTERTTATFLNRMISTIAKFLHSTKKTSLEPLRYFTALHANVPLDGHPVKRMPDVMLTRLIDGYTREGPLRWQDVQALVEQTQEKKPPIWMPQAVSIKSYLTFCTQPERDYIPILCITGEGFHIVLTDHVGQIETDVIPFNRNSSTLIFFRMVMGLAFLPDSMMGLDTTIIRRELGVSSGKKFSDVYPPFDYEITRPSIQFLYPPSNQLSDPPLAVTHDAAPADRDQEFGSISIGSETYPILQFLFRTPTLIGRATSTFLVQLPDGRRGVLKDSWITTDRMTEASFLQGLDIPFGLKLIDHCVLGNTSSFRDSPIKMSLNKEVREKRRIVTYPAGVHISDFTSLWELMVAMLDVVIAIMYLEGKRKLHRDISYTNILLREPEDDLVQKEARKQFMMLLGLSEIEELREELRCREGLLIDFDYGAALADLETQMAEPENAERDLEDGEIERAEEDDEEDENEQQEEADWVVPEGTQSTGEVVQDSHVTHALKAPGARTGTAPFIAIELLIHGTAHRVAHDLESILYVLLFLCSHLQGPSGNVRNPPLYGSAESCLHPSNIKEWLCANNLGTLGHLKFSHMIGHFESHILPHISPYFYPLRPHLSTFRDTLLPRGLNSAAKEAVHSLATCQDVIDVFKNALLDQTLIEEAEKARSVLSKRSFPGDLVVAPNGWDVIKVPKTLLNAKPKLSPTASRKTRLMTRGRRAQGTK